MSQTGLPDDLTVNIPWLGDMSKNSTSHSHGKKKGVNVLADDSGLPFHTIVFRAGWLAKNLHTAFDYIFNSVKKDDSCGHVQGGWTEKLDGEYLGGISPDFGSIKTEVDKAKNFVKLLFFSQAEFVDLSVLCLLFASILRFWPDLLMLLSKEPANKFKNEHHPVVMKMKLTMQECDVSQKLFDVWMQEVTTDFIEKNWQSLPENQLREDVKADVRNVVSYLKRMERNTDACYHANLEVKRELNALRSENYELKRKIEYLEQLPAQIHELTKEIREMKRNKNLFGNATDNNDNCHSDDDDSFTRNDNGIHENTHNVSQHNDTQHTVLTWEYVSNKITSCNMEEILLCYYNLELENVYNKSSKPEDARSKKKRIMQVVNGLLYFKPEGLHIISKPNQPRMLLEWKDQLTTISKEICKKAKTVFDGLNTNMAWNRSNFHKKLGAMKKSLTENERDV